MSKIINAIEIGSTAVKLVIGYVLEQEVVVLHAVKKDLPDKVINGNIVNDADVVCKAIKEAILDAENTLKVDINDVALVLPSRGLEVFENTGSTNVVSLNKTIADVDIRNVMTILLRDKYSEENEVIDVIPITYMLDQERTFSNPPINENSGSLKLKAFIHTIPRYIKETYIGLVDKVGLKVSNVIVGPYGVAQLFMNYKNLPNKYFLINIGGKETTITVISGGKPYQSSIVDIGSENLTQEMMYRMGISYQTANKLKCLYGLDVNKCDFKPIICHGGQDKKTGFRVDDVRIIAEEFTNNLLRDINRALKTIINGNVELEQWPLVFVGGGTQLLGFSEFVINKYDSRSVLFPSIKSLGARDQCFLEALGALKVSTCIRINEIKEEQKAPVLTREKHKVQKYSETDDKL